MVAPIKKGPAPDDHFGADPDCRVILSTSRRVSSAGGCPTVGSRIISAADVREAADGAAFSAPDNHLSAGPDGGVIVACLRRVSRAGWCSSGGRQRRGYPGESLCRGQNFKQKITKETKIALRPKAEQLRSLRCLVFNLLPFTLLWRCSQGGGYSVIGDSCGEFSINRRSTDSTFTQGKLSIVPQH